MKFTKKLLLIVLTLVFTMSLFAGCGKKAPEQNQGEKPKEKGLKIAIVTGASGVDDGSFNQDNYNGILKFIKDHPESTVKAVKSPSYDVTTAIQTVADIVADYDVIVTPGFEFAGISQLAEENPNTKFVLVDTEPTPVGDKKEFENVLSMTFAEQEGGFFAGVSAALETKTNKVAVVNGIAYPSNVNYQYGFESGVNYANAKYGKKVEIVEIASYAGTDVTGKNVGGNYIGSFADESTGKVVGNALIQKGVDIMFVAAGASGNGVFTAAKEAKNVKVIGCDVDQYDDGVSGSGNIILTSALKVMSTNVDRALTSILDGSFKGANKLMKADTDSTGYVSAAGRHQLSDDTLTKLKEVYKLVQDGTVVPASNFNGHTPENFPGLK